MTDDLSRAMMNALVAAVKCPDCNVLVGTDTETGQTRIQHGSGCPTLGADKRAAGVANDQPLHGSVIIELDLQEGKDNGTHTD
ncbi:hypothetical protein [Mycobacterium sp.]|uniref:hypothetical protein n=1 Tax=Mycobacterium sp. TaxID=1785 RepID=UPI003F97717B